MRTLFILRHAKSSHDDDAADRERTLTSRGRKDARRMGELSRDQGLLPERILCSTATRARETLALYLEGSGSEPRTELLDSLYLAEPDVYVHALAERGGCAERVMVVGHNPGLEDLVRELTGERVELPTAALVECSLPIEAWSELTLATAGQLHSIFRPKDDV